MITTLRRILSSVPSALSSTLHILGLIALGVWLVILPLLGLAHPSAVAELIGGNYTNVTSDLGACIAAGGVVHIARKQHDHTFLIEALHDSLKHLHIRHSLLAKKHNLLVDQVKSGLVESGLVGVDAEQQPAPPAQPAPPTGS